jgi:hypothetical protein
MQEFLYASQFLASSASWHKSNLQHDVTNANTRENRITRIVPDDEAHAPDFVPLE